MKQYVIMVSNNEHRIEAIKVGFNWIFLFFSWVLGVPLFFRRLYGWGLLILAIELLSSLKAHFCSSVLTFGWLDNRVQWHLSSYLLLGEWSGLLILILSVYLGIRGNEIIARNRLQRGWHFQDSEEPITRFAKVKWHMPV